MAVVYARERLAEVVADSTTLREVAVKLGARPAAGTLSHLRRRIAEAGIDVRHFPGLNRKRPELPFTREELASAAAVSASVRAVARLLGIPDDGRQRNALHRALTENGIDISHFTRRPRRAAGPGFPRTTADRVLRQLPDGAPRTNRARLGRALDEVGVPYRCADCGNEGEWRGAVMTLQIDHVDGDWRNNLRENLRYLCPNCHAITSTWCRKNHSTRSGGG